jgi:hypothetical protein
VRLANKKALLNVVTNALDLPVIMFFMNEGLAQTKAGMLGNVTSAISLIECGVNSGFINIVI